MKRTKLWLTALAMFASTASTLAGEPGHGIHTNPGYTTFVGDLPEESTGQMPAVSDVDPWAAEDPRVAQTRYNSPSQYTKPARLRRPSTLHTPSSLRRMSAMGSGFNSGCDSACDVGCDVGCGCDSACDVAYDGACDSMCGRKRRSIFSLGGGRSHGAWGSIEATLWWSQDRKSPALVSMADPGVLPAVPMLGTVAFGGQGGIDAGLLAGNRVDFGRYFGSNETFGIGARVYGFWDGGTSSSYSSNGSGPSLGVPFFDVADPFNNGVAVGNFGVLPIGLNQGFGTVFTGDVSAEADMDFVGSEVYARMALMKNGSSRIDLLGGYTFHSLNDAIVLQGTSVQNNTVGGILTPQNTFTFRDDYATKNTFHGGQIGFESTLNKGRWRFSSLTKVHLGNMNQKAHIQGHSTYTNNNVGSTASSNSNGLLVQGNGGNYERNVFTFVPEANVKLGYRLGKHTTFNVGYTLMLWSDVALAGNHIDNRIDSGRVYPTSPAQPLRTTVPEFAWNSQSFYLHGLDLGLSFTY